MLKHANAVENAKVSVKDVCQTKSDEVYLYPLFPILCLREGYKGFADNPSASLDGKDTGLSAFILYLFSFFGDY